MIRISRCNVRKMETTQRGLETMIFGVIVLGGLALVGLILYVTVHFMLRFW